jgi:hypothetical protein
MIHITSDGGWIGPLCWSNTLPAFVVPDYRFAGISSCLQPWGRTYWRLPGEPFRPLTKHKQYTVTESFQ